MNNYQLSVFPEESIQVYSGHDLRFTDNCSLVIDYCSLLNRFQDFPRIGEASDFQFREHEFPVYRDLKGSSTAGN